MCFICSTATHLHVFYNIYVCYNDISVENILIILLINSKNSKSCSCSNDSKTEVINCQMAVNEELVLCQVFVCSLGFVE